MFRPILAILNAIVYTLWKVQTPLQFSPVIRNVRAFVLFRVYRLFPRGWWPGLAEIRKDIFNVLLYLILYSLIFDIHVTVHRDKFLTIKPTRCTNFSNLFLEWNSICFGQFLCPSSGVFHCTHSNGICHTGMLTACEQEHMLLLTSSYNKINILKSFL